MPRPISLVTARLALPLLVLGFGASAVSALERPLTSRRAVLARGLALAPVTQLWSAAAAEDAGGAEQELRAELERLQLKLSQLTERPAPAEAAVESVSPPPPPPPPPALGPVVEATEPPAPPAPVPAVGGPTAFDFDVPFRGEPYDIQPFMGQKASLVVNVKFDDPITIDQLPTLQGLASRYSSEGLHVLAFPTDQGWFEADDSDTLRLRFKSVYDFGKYPSAVVFDKADLLGTNAMPLYTWLTSSFPNPWGVNRIVFNYEKFLLDSRGVPLRRYPRKYPPQLIEADVRNHPDLHSAPCARVPMPPPHPCTCTCTCTCICTCTCNMCMDMDMDMDMDMCMHNMDVYVPTQAGYLGLATPSNPPPLACALPHRCKRC